MNNVGDAYNGKPSESYQHTIADSGYSYIYDDSHIGETAKWMLMRANGGKGDTYVSKEFLTTVYNLNDAKSVLPVKKANDRMFYDVGWTGMYSDISDDYRIGNGNLVPFQYLFFIVLQQILVIRNPVTYRIVGGIYIQTGS